MPPLNRTALLENLEVIDIAYYLWNQYLSIVELT
jgi:hypothetical protein